MDQMAGFDDSQTSMAADGLRIEFENEILCFFSLVRWTSARCLCEFMLIQICRAIDEYGSIATSVPQHPRPAKSSQVFESQISREMDR